MNPVQILNTLDVLLTGTVKSSQPNKDKKFQCGANRISDYDTSNHKMCSKRQRSLENICGYNRKQFKAVRPGEP